MLKKYVNLALCTFIVFIVIEQVLGVLMVAQNMFQLLVGIKALPVGTKVSCILIEQVLGVLMVAQNMFQLLVGIKALPVGTKVSCIDAMLTLSQ